MIYKLKLVMYILIYKELYCGILIKNGNSLLASLSTPQVFIGKDTPLFLPIPKLKESSSRLTRNRGLSWIDDNGVSIQDICIGPRAANSYWIWAFQKMQGGSSFVRFHYRFSQDHTFYLYSSFLLLKLFGPCLIENLVLLWHASSGSFEMFARV